MWSEVLKCSWGELRVLCVLLVALGWNPPSVGSPHWCLGRGQVSGGELSVFFFCTCSSGSFVRLTFDVWISQGPEIQLGSCLVSLYFVPCSFVFPRLFPSEELKPFYRPYSTFTQEEKSDTRHMTYGETEVCIDSGHGRHAALSQGLGIRCLMTLTHTLLFSCSQLTAGYDPRFLHIQSRTMGLGDGSVSLLLKIWVQSPL